MNSLYFSRAGLLGLVIWAFVACGVGRAQAPEVTLSPSATSVTVGQTVYFTVTTSSGSGLNELGLEGCDARRDPYPLSSSGVTGQAIGFSVSATSGSGLAVIGLEGCDAAGNPTVNLGAIAVSGGAASTR